MAYLNNDGLYKKYGTEKATANKGGAYVMPGALREIEIKGLDLTTLATATETIVSDVLFFPADHIVEEVTIWTRTAATSGGAATLDLGLVQGDRSTAVDVDGFLQAVALGDMNADGERVTKVGPPAAGGIGAFADKDTVPTVTGYITAGAGTAVFTAGIVDIRIRFKPLV